MPNCFTLTPKDGDKPKVFAEIDDEMREHFGAPADAENWYLGWYDTIGLLLALGKTWDEIRTTLPTLSHIVDYLEERYIPNAWYEVGGRR